MTTYNQLGQPIGALLPDWTPRPLPPRTPMVGRFCRVEPLQVEQHSAELFAANSLDTEGRMWTYLNCGPFATLSEYQRWTRVTCGGEDPLFHAIIDMATGRAVGIASYLRIAPGAGSIEVGHVAFSPLLQRQPAATEVMFLLMQRAFALGYRRCEWKCDALNAPSRAAAQRLGFTFEGVFRQALVYKGRNRDTAWFSIIDREWPALEEAFTRWLDPTNFDAQGQQRQRLGELHTRV